MALERFYVDGLSRVEPDPTTGIVRLTFSVSDNKKDEETLQIVVHVDRLQQIFKTVGDTMQSSFGQGRGPGGRGGPPRGRNPAPAMKNLSDLTED